MKRGLLLLTAAAAALAAGQVAAQRPPPGAGVTGAQNNNGGGQQSFGDVLAGDVAAGRLTQDQANRLQARANEVGETFNRATAEAGQRFAGTNQANILAIEQGAIDAVGRGSGSQATAAVDFTSAALGRRAAFTNEVGILAEERNRGANAIIQERARMIAENPNVPEAERRRVQNEADQANRAVSRIRATIDQQEADIRETRARVDANRDYLTSRVQDNIDRYGSDPRNWPQPPAEPRQPGGTPPPPPAPPPPRSVSQPPPPPAMPSGPPRRGTIPDPNYVDPATQLQTRPPTQAEQRARRQSAQEAAQRAAAQQEAQRRAAEEAARRNRPPPPPPPSWPPPLNRPPTVLAPVYGPPVPNSQIPRARPANPDDLSLPGRGGSGRGGGGGGGGSERGPFEFRPIPGNAFVEGENDWLGDAAGGGPWSVGDSLAWADMLARMTLRPPTGSEPWRGFERGLPTTVAELEAIYEGWDINTAPPGSSGRSFSSAGNSPRMDWYLPGFGALSDELAFYDAMGWLFRSASEGGPWIEWGQLDLANVAVRVNGNGQPMPGSLAEFLRDNYYVNFPAFWDGALNFDMWQYDPIADRDRELARLLYGPLWSDRPYRLTFDPTGRLGQFSPDSVLAGFLSDLSFDDFLVSLLRGGIGGLDRLRAQPFNVLLTWRQGAFDVDLHMTGPTGLPDNSRFHIFYAATGALDRPPFAQLIRDCICRSGSEAILTTQLLQGGVYRISAFNFGNQSTSSTELSTNADLRLLIVRGGAAVSVGNGTTIQGGTVVFAGAPTAGRPGNTWVGVEIDPRTGQIRFVNRSDNSVNGDGTGAVLSGSRLSPAMQMPPMGVPGARQGGPEQ